MTRDAPAAATIGAYQVACRVEDQASGFLVHRVGGPDALLHVLHLVAPPDLSLASAAREVERFGALTHPALPRLLEVFEHETQLALVFERTDGLRLDRLKGYLDRDRERLPDAAVWQLGWQGLGALAQAHLARDDQGALAPFVHGMLSPRDILVTWDGAVMVDGLCPYIQAHGSSDQGTESMPAGIWLAPEVRRGDQATAKSDAYSLAMILRSLLTGRPPQAPGVSIRPLAVARPDLPSDVTHALDRALDPAPRLRPSCAELSHRLAGLARMAKAQTALRESMELYQALWGLWSVAAPEVWSQEEPVLPPGAGAPAPREGGGDTPWDSVPARDSTVDLDWDDIENAPRTSRSPGQMKEGATAAGTATEEPASGEAPAPPSDGDGAAAPASHRGEHGEPGEAADPAPADSASEPERPESTPPAADRGDEGREPARVSSSPAPSVPAPWSEAPATATSTSAPTGGWGRWLVMGLLAVAAAVAAWHTLRPAPAGTPGGTEAGRDAGARPPVTGPDVPAAPPATTSAVGEAPTVVADGPSAASGTATSPGAFAAVPPGKLLSFQGYLTVRSSAAAEVYVKGVSIGPTNQRNVSHCRQKYVRLGVPPGPRWLSPGQTVSIPCRGETTVTIEPAPEQAGRR